MLAQFVGGSEICKAYEAAMYDPSVDLVIIQGSLGAAATRKLAEIAVLDDPESRVIGLKSVLHNELGRLEEAEAGIKAWADSVQLPDELVVIPSLEAPVGQRKNNTATHFDSATAIDELIHGPFAISIGTDGQRVFKSIRFPRRLTDDELLGKEPWLFDEFESLWTWKGRFASPATEVLQDRGDIMLIPGTPQPALHGVEAIPGTESTAIIGSYVVTPNRGITPEELRKNAIELKNLERECLIKFIKMRMGE